MNLISLQFGVFFAGSLFLYYVIPEKMRWWVLLAASAAFYLLSATPFTALYLVFSIVSVYFGARYITEEKSKHKKAAYIIVLCANVALILMLKYMNGLWVASHRVFSLIGVNLPHFELGWIAPLGMSFYMLQLIGYLTDVYWGIFPAQRNIMKLTLFASYFPSFSSGPILRYNQIEDELFQGHRATYRNITFGAQRMLWGLFKKMVIAERLAAITSTIFSDIGVYTGVWLWVGIFASIIQIYADFSGNMDFIIGASQCFGVVLPENFRQPFFSLTIQEFWQRWHITLGSWLKDYIMYPLQHSALWVKLGKSIKTSLGKKAAKLIPTFLALLVLWLVNGLWHGGYPKYFATVSWFWFAVISGQLLKPVGDKTVRLFSINTNCFSWRLFQRMRTIAVYSVGALFFAAPGIMDALRIAKRALLARNFFELFSPNTFFSDKLLGVTGGIGGLRVLLVSFLLLVAVEVFQNRDKHVREWLAKQNLVFRWAFLLGLIFAILLFGIYGPGYNASDFIYAGF